MTSLNDDAGEPSLAALDEGLLLAARVGLQMERDGRPLAAWQQRLIDRSMVAFCTTRGSA